MKRAWRYLGYLLEFLKYNMLFPLALWKYRGKTVYLLAERGTDARDNGYHMFRYIREKHPELEAYYVIDRGSVDYPKVAAYGNVVFRGTLQHYLLFIAAKYKISTHIAGYSPYMYFYSRFARLLVWKGKRVFLQHGVIIADLTFLYKENANVDLFICGARPEYEYVAGNYHYDNQVKYTGLARYDALHDFECKNQILIMPTWRLFLENLSKDELKASDYVVRWNEILRNQQLKEALRSAGCKLVFYPHHEMQKNISLFSVPKEDDTVIIADFAHYDVQQLLKESRLLVTDYSSVYFDFAYMKKPCVYYHFDFERFYSEHYKTGYFDYTAMGFGEVVQDGEELVRVLIEYIKSNFELKAVYAKRTEGFFELHDNNNCERIFNEIQKMN